jgi:hypothetical protein
MTQPDDPAAATSKPWARLLLATARVVLAIALLAAATLPLSAPATPSASAQTEAGFAEEEGEEETEWEFEEEDEEEGEEDSEGGTPGSAVLPPVCLVRTAAPSIVALLAHESLTLTLHYTATSPTKVTVEYWLKGSKGTLALGSDTHHFGKQGVLHLSRHLDQREMAKVRAARAFMVALDVPDAPASCNRFLTLRLTAKHSLGSRATWSVPLERHS